MSAEPIRLAEDQLAALADLVADRLRASAVSATVLVSAAQLADQLGTSREWVYRNANALGAVRLPSSPAAAEARLPGSKERGRLRFDVQAAHALTALDLPVAPTTNSPARHRSRKDSRTPGAVLAVRPRQQQEE